MPVPSPISSMSLDAHPGAGTVLGERRDVSVVVDEHGQPEPFAHQRAEADIVERQVHGDHRGAAAPVDQRRNAETDRINLARCRVNQFLNRFGNSVEQRRGVFAEHRTLYALVDLQPIIDHPAR